jgi:hypothetical protein
LETSKGTVLGHTVVAANPQVTGLVIGANSPKPARASKRFAADGLVSSFISADKITSAKAAGWKVRPSRNTRGKSVSNFSSTRYILINGVKYAWQPRKETLTKIAAQEAALGIKTPTANDIDLVFGASFPKPPKAALVTITGDEVTTSSSFIDTSALDNLPNGYQKTSNGNYTANGVG